MKNIICNLCAGSPDIELYKILTKDKIIQTDICIGKEIEYLVNKDVKTYGCCCGHGEIKPSCLVDICNKNKLEELGYNLHEFSEEHTENGICKIYLKTDIQCELRKVIGNKVWKYLEERKKCIQCPSCNGNKQYIKDNNPIIKTNKLGLPFISGGGKTMREIYNEDYR